MDNMFSLALKLAQDFINIERKGGQENSDDNDQNGNLTKPVTQEMIARNVDQVMKLYPQWESTLKHKLVKELETRYCVWIGEETVLVGDDDHVDWLDSERKEGWKYWERYEQYLDSKMAEESVKAVDRFTDRILSLLEDPKRQGAWDRRGLVVGHVQQGKTSNYTGLICKAADAGYKLIVVLAGVHKNLRSQTQMRLDEGFLGYESKALGDRGGLKPIGVGLINSDPEIRPDSITNRSDGGDFNRRVAESFSINPGGRPLLYVIKKNASVLKNVLDWVRWAASSTDPETGRAIINNVPLLVIDDEADHASVDTKEQGFDEDGNPDPDHDPTKINGYIRQILYSFEKSAYVGYTATPFANIYIHEKGATAEEGEDLFPRSFVVNLPAPSNYFGPSRIFGLDPDADEQSPPLPLVRIIDDYADSLQSDERNGWMPPKHKNGHVPLLDGQNEIPPSLREAIHAFVLSCAVRKVRELELKHNSMLIHVTRFTSCQHIVYNQVKEEMDRIEARLSRGEGSEKNTILAQLRDLWDRDFLQTTRDMRSLVDDPFISEVSWEDIVPLLKNIVADIKVKEVNGSAGDVLDYENHKEKGLNVITIGGDKLARGLTLEGLSVSYFLRATRMYDTLMQMGRWFGYRPGYSDVSRLYIAPELSEWFQHITRASEELRQEFDHMAAVGGTPADYGLKVRSHPAMMITSRVKMRHGTEISLTFAKSISETIVFHTDENIIKRNFNTTQDFIRQLGTPSVSNPELSRPNNAIQKWKDSYLWTGVSVDGIKAFLDSFITHEDAVEVNSQLLLRYIKAQNEEGELVDWTVALISGGTGGDFQIAGLPLNLIKRERSSRLQKVDPSKYVIRRLLSPRDEGIDITCEQYQAALQQTILDWHADAGRSRRKEEPVTPSGPSLRLQRDCRKGLLILYPLSSEEGKLEWEFPVIGMGISFPYSEKARKITYRVNNIYWMQEFAGVNS